MCRLCDGHKLFFFLRLSFQVPKLTETQIKLSHFQLFDSDASSRCVGYARDTSYFFFSDFFSKSPKRKLNLVIFNISLLTLLAVLSAWQGIQLFFFLQFFSKSPNWPKRKLNLGIFNFSIMTLLADVSTMRGTQFIFFSPTFFLSPQIDRNAN